MCVYVLFREELLSFNCRFHTDGTLGDGTGSLPCLSFYLPTYPAGSLSALSALSALSLSLSPQRLSKCIFWDLKPKMLVYSSRSQVLWMYLQTGFTFVYFCFGVCTCIHECDTLLFERDTLSVVKCIPSSILIQLLYAVLLHLFWSSIWECAILLWIIEYIFNLCVNVCVTTLRVLRLSWVDGLVTAFCVCACSPLARCGQTGKCNWREPWGVCACGVCVWAEHGGRLRLIHSG